jgi:peptidyl-prolyl cis-trans isomerase SurA
MKAINVPLFVKFIILQTKMISWPVRRVTYAMGLATLVLLGQMGHLQAQVSLFATAIKVNDQAINYYEINQRILLERFLGKSGDLNKAAQNFLIEDRLRLEEAERLGVTADLIDVDKAFADFAGSNKKTVLQLSKHLAIIGIDESFLRDFLKVDIIWRDVIRGRFISRTEILPSDIDRALLSQTHVDSTRVLVSELIMALNPSNREQAVGFIASLRELELSQDQFSQLAQKYSSAGSASAGGKLDWLSLSKLPPSVANAVKTLSIGEVTSPIFLKNAVAVFQMRGIDENGIIEALAITYDYALINVPSSAFLQMIKKTVDSCDDLFIFSKDDPAVKIERFSKNHMDIESDIALALSKIDLSEIGILPQKNGEEIAVMMCNVATKASATLDREQIKNFLLNQRITDLSQAYLSELLASAIIIRP